jgi:hypothetical protein
MSINPQITPRRVGVRPARSGRLLTALRILAVAVVLAVTLSPHGGPVAAAAALRVASPAPTLAVAGARTGEARSGGGGTGVAGGTRVVAGAGVVAGTGSVGQAVPGTQGAVAAPRQGAVVVPRQGAVADPRVRARAVILADESTGQVLFERNASSARAMASTTKVMTALLALERLDERKVVVIGSGPPEVGEESLRLRKGERLTVRQLLLGLLVKSANDAGAALAEAVDGSQAAFVRRMNRKAAALRLSATHYVTPYGLDRPGHQTSARDLARLWEVAMRRADFRSLVATRAARIPGGPLSLRRFVTTNQLLGSYRWTVGGKTGFTNRAGRCLRLSQRLPGRAGPVRLRLLQVRPGPPCPARPAGRGGLRPPGRLPGRRRRRRPRSPRPARPGPAEHPQGIDRRAGLGLVHRHRTAAGQRPTGPAPGERSRTGRDPDTPNRCERAGNGRDHAGAGNGRPGSGDPHRRSPGQTLAGPS